MQRVKTFTDYSLIIVAEMYIIFRSELIQQMNSGPYSLGTKWSNHQEYKRIIKYISTRWLSLKAAVGPALRLPPLLTSYFLSEEDKSLRFERHREHFENPMLEAYLLFYQF